MGPRVAFTGTSRKQRSALAVAPGNGKTALVPAGANGQTADMAVVLQTLGRMEEQMGRLEKQQALLLESQEGHYEDLEELEGNVEQALEDGTNILDNLEAGSRQGISPMACHTALAVAIAAKAQGSQLHTNQRGATALLRQGVGIVQTAALV